MSGSNKNKQSELDIAANGIYMQYPDEKIDAFFETVDIRKLAKLQKETGLTYNEMTKEQQESVKKNK